MIEKISINKNNANIWPAFFDYDLLNIKPRGYSGRLEVFSFGEINKKLLETKFLDSIVLIMSRKLSFMTGVFLVDYSEIIKDIEKFVDTILDMKLGNIIYMAESQHFNVEDYFRFYKKIFIKFFIFE
jgi:ABC-type phosphate transport system permease subunit